MKQSKISPHVTVSALVSDNKAALLSETESIAASMNKGFIWFTNIGVFNPAKRIVLASAEPYKELKSWELKEQL